MTDLIKATLTNLEPGPRGVETAAGLVMIDPRAEVRAELTAGELAAAANSGWFLVTALDDTPQPKRRAR